MLAVMALEDPFLTAYAKVLHPAAPGHFHMLSEDQLTEARDRYIRIKRRDAREGVRPAEIQLSALEAWIMAAPGGRYRAPRVCLGLWTPFFEVTYEDNAFAPQQRCADGVVRPTRARGPPDFKTWSRHWAVFEAAMISLGHASAESLEDYRLGIELLSDRFPTADDWARIATADALVRNSQWDRMREERIRLKEMRPTDGWDLIIADSAYRGMSTRSSLSAWWETNCWWPLLSARNPTLAAPRCSRRRRATWTPSRRARLRVTSWVRAARRPWRTLPSAAARRWRTPPPGAAMRSRPRAATSRS